MEDLKKRVELLEEEVRLLKAEIETIKANQMNVVETKVPSVMIKKEKQTSPELTFVEKLKAINEETKPENTVHKQQELSSISHNDSVKGKEEVTTYQTVHPVDNQKTKKQSKS